MKRSLLILAAMAVCGLSCSQAGSAASKADEAMKFIGTSDSSAAVAVDDRLMLVGDDENNVLRLYDVSKPSTPLQSFDLTDFLKIDSEHPEADIEGATRVGNRIYWITSHGRNKEGKDRPNRYRFFATDFEVVGGKLTLKTVGKPCITLAHQLADSSLGSALGIDRATMFGRDLSKKQRQKLAPKDEGLNIEALAASVDGQTLYIGLRNPQVKLSGSKRAIVIPLKNARAVVERSATCEFGKAMLWDLAGMGVRAMEYSSRDKAFFLVAGPVDEGAGFALYRWSGDEAKAPKLVGPVKTKLADFKPESIVCFKDSDSLVLLSDDGTIKVKVSGPDECIDEDAYDSRTGSCEQKYLLDWRRKSFRAIIVKP